MFCERKREREREKSRLDDLRGGEIVMEESRQKQ